MVSTRDKAVVKSELIDYISSFGIKVNTVTKARGNKGFFKEGRIDVAKNLDDEATIRTLVHEYAHFVNYKLDKRFKRFEVLFKSDDKEFEDELVAVTNYIDTNSLLEVLYCEREKLKNAIKKLTLSIREVYPEFKASEDFGAFKKYSRWSNLSYLEKYDRVKLHSWFSHRVYSISNVRKDFPNVPDVFVDYLRLRSKQRKRAKISRRILKMQKYYNSPCELFARFVEGLYVDDENVRQLAPEVYNRFVELLDADYYVGLRGMFSILGVSFEKIH